jgi:hypothetical protein
MTNESRSSRISLTKAEVTLNEVRTLYQGQQYQASEEKLKEAEANLSNAERLITPVLSRYGTRARLENGKSAEETIEESADREITHCCDQASESYIL